MNLCFLMIALGKRVENGKGGKDGLRELVEHYNVSASFLFLHGILI